jgi:ferredoxin
MEVRVDRDGCVGSGQCAMRVPAVFDQSDEDGKVLLISPAVGPGLERAVRGAVARCPSGSISLREEPGDA